MHSFDNTSKKVVLLFACLIYALVTLTQAGNKAVGVMKAGQTFTIEPMINAGICKFYNCVPCELIIYLASNILINVLIGIWRDRMWPDGWTAVTADGKRSAQFEHTLLVIAHFCSL